MHWLERTPRAVVRAHLVMLPRLEAAESLLVAQRVAAGTRAISRDGLRDLTREWVRVARGDQPAERPDSKTSMQAFGASAGIGYREVPAR